LDFTVQQLIDKACKQWNCTPSEAKLHLHTNLWDIAIDVDSQLAMTRQTSQEKKK